MKRPLNASGFKRTILQLGIPNSKQEAVNLND